MSEIKQIQLNFEEKFRNISSKEDLQILKTEFFGKNGLISTQFKKMGSLNENEKKIFAKDLNNLKDFVTEKIENKFKEFEDLIINEKLKGE